MAGVRPGKKKSSKPSSGQDSNQSTGSDNKRKKSRVKSGGGTKKTPFQHIQELAKWVDLVIEVLDSRLPLSTRHPNAQEIFGKKPRIFVLTKEDLADVEKTRELANRLSEESGAGSAIVSLKRSSGRDKIVNMALDITAGKMEALAKKGILPRPMRVCVVGLPNVGKSSLINWLIGRKKTKTGNKPGITQGTQWVRVHPKLELLDTPGILPAFSYDHQVRAKLAVLNLVPQSSYNFEEAAQDAFKYMQLEYPDLLESYIPGLGESEDGFIYLAEKRNLLGPKASFDRTRACSIFLSELRDGKLGRITLD